MWTGAKFEYIFANHVATCLLKRTIVAMNGPRRSGIAHEEQNMNPVPTSALTHLGQQLKRPECIVATAAGRLFVSDRDCAVREVMQDHTTVPVARETPAGFLCNGYSLLKDGSFLIANLGDAGGVWRLRPGGVPEPVLTEVEGEALPPTNFVNAVSEGRAWVSVSTRHIPRERAFKRELADGFIVFMDAQGSRIVADDIGFTNENKLHPDGQWLYVSETIARRLSRYKVRDNGDLGPRQTVVEFGGDGIWPDGFEFDAQGGIWIASVVSNRLLRLSPQGEINVIIDDSNTEAVAQAESSFSEGSFSRANIDAGRNGALGNLASITFAGPDLKTVYLGSLFGDRLASFQSPIPGAPPHHWHY